MVLIQLLLCILCYRTAQAVKYKQSLYYYRFFRGDNCEAVIDMIDKQVQKVRTVPKNGICMKFKLINLYPEQVNTEREDRKAHEKKLEEKISKVDDNPGVIKCLLGERKSQAAASEWP